MDRGSRRRLRGSPERMPAVCREALLRRKQGPGERCPAQRPTFQVLLSLDPTFGKIVPVQGTDAEALNTLCQRCPLPSLRRRVVRRNRTDPDGMLRRDVEVAFMTYIMIVGILLSTGSSQYLFGRNESRQHFRYALGRAYGW